MVAWLAGTLLTAEDISVAAALAHTALSENLVRPQELGGSLDEMLTMLAAVKDVSDHKVLLSVIGRVLRARPAMDDALVLDIIKSLQPSLCVIIVDDEAVEETIACTDAGC